MDEPSHGCEQGPSVNGEWGPPWVEPPPQQGPQWALGSSVAVSMATRKEGGGRGKRLRIDPAQSDSIPGKNGFFLMRLLAALKTQIEFKRRQTPPSENNLASEGPGGQLAQLRLALGGVRAGRRRPHCHPRSSGTVPQGCAWLCSGAEQAAQPEERALLGQG